MSVSCGYSGAARAPSGGASHKYWPRSDLRVAAAISICELINRPDQFVSQSPHFVVDNLDWIQCRYLLLRVNPTAEALKNPLFAPAASSGSGYVVQDPEHIISGYSGPLKIPLNVLSMEGRQGACELTLHNTTTAPRDESVNISNVENSTDMPLGLERTNDDSKSLTRPRRSLSAAEDHSLDATACHKMILDDDQVDQSSPTKRLRALTFTPATLNLDSLHLLPEPEWATTSSIALRTLAKEIAQLHKAQSQRPVASLGWYINTTKVENLFQWIVELHTFDPDLPLAKDMEQKGCTSIILEIRFGPNFPFSPPFVRIVRPRFLPFMKGGGGHVTSGGAICSEMLTNSGWSPALSMENVLVQLRSGLCDTERHARLEMGTVGGMGYGMGEAVEAYRRTANAHGWGVSDDLEIISAGWTAKSTTK